MRNWGKSKLKYCPIINKVWQISSRNNKEDILVLYDDMPTYGLDKQQAPTDLKIRKAQRQMRSCV